MDTKPSGSNTTIMLFGLLLVMLSCVFYCCVCSALGYYYYYILPTPTPSSTEDSTEDPTPTPIPWKLSENLVKVGVIIICNETPTPIDITDIFKEMLEKVEDDNDIQSSDTTRYICNQAKIDDLELVAGYTNFACVHGNTEQGSRKFFNDLDAKINNQCGGEPKYFLRYIDEIGNIKNASISPQLSGYIDLSRDINEIEINILGEKTDLYAWLGE